MPTLLTLFVQAEKIVMILDGMPGLLNDNETSIWEDVTSKHIIHYHAALEADFPDISIFNITIVNTVLLAQSIVEVSESFNNAVVLKLEYSQDITYGIYNNLDVTEENVNAFLFVLPFESDSKSYKIELMDALEISNWILLDSITLGDPTPPPTPAPVNNESLSQTAVRAISASIVLGACVIVAFLLWDRNRKDFRYHEDFSERSDEPFRRGPSQQELDTTEYDNAGQPIDWANPYSDTGVAAVRTTTTDRGAGGGALKDDSSVDEGSVTTEIVALKGNGIMGEDSPRSGGEQVPDDTTTTPAGVGQLSTVESSAMLVPSPNPVGRNGPLSSSRSSYQPSRTAVGSGNLPPLAPTLSGGGGGSGNQQNPQPGRYTLNSRGMFPSPLPPPHHHGGFRHTSVTDTDITDLTYSDGGFQSDRGSDTGLPSQLPTINDDRYVPNKKIVLQQPHQQKILDRHFVVVWCMIAKVSN
jgi:hypothetical protein